MKYAIALEGGGAKGAYHAGALKALKELGIEIEAVTGTSIGSINGAFFIQEGVEPLIEFWENITPERLIPDKYPILKEALVSGTVNDYRKFLKEIRGTISDRGLDLTNFKQTLYEFIDEKTIREKSINFGLVTYSLTDLKAEELILKDIPEGKLIEYLIASSYLPVFKRERISGKAFLDGAFYDNLPVNLLIENGYKKIIAIELLGIGLKKKVKSDDVEIINIKPSDDTGGIVDFREGLSHKNILMGYYDTMRIFKLLYGKWYYLTDMWSPKKAYDFIDHLTEEQVHGLADVLYLDRIPYKRCLFERIVPGMMKLLDIPEQADYNMILLYILEYLGKKLEVERYQMLTMDQLIDLIKDQLYQTSQETIDWRESLVKLMQTTNIYSSTFKDKVILACAQIIITGKNEGGPDGL
ncbi:MAG: patatin-like phospholipase family protein [Clostridia bacterium]|nr:patatin-like phospholipase family protein [Clostridia bacterium]